MDARLMNMEKKLLLVGRGEAKEERFCHMLFSLLECRRVQGISLYFGVEFAYCIRLVNRQSESFHLNYVKVVYLKVHLQHDVEEQGVPQPCLVVIKFCLAIIAIHQARVIAMTPSRKSTAHMNPSHRPYFYSFVMEERDHLCMLSYCRLRARRHHRDMRGFYHSFLGQSCRWK